MLSASETNFATSIVQDYILNPTFFGLVASGVVAVLLAFLVESRKNIREKNEDRLTLATLLGYEVEAIRQHAKNVEISSRAYIPHIETLEQFVNSEQAPTIGLTITDADYPTAVFDRPSIDLGLFDLDTAFSITELYRWAKFQDQRKDAINRTELELRQINPIAVSGTISNVWLSRARLILASAKTYASNTKTVESLASDCLKNLGKYAKINASRVRIEQQIPATNQTRTTSEDP